MHGSGGALCTALAGVVIPEGAADPSSRSTKLVPDASGGGGLGFFAAALGLGSALPAVLAGVVVHEAGIEVSAATSHHLVSTRRHQGRRFGLGLDRDEVVRRGPSRRRGTRPRAR